MKVGGDAFCFTARASATIIDRMRWGWGFVVLAGCGPSVLVGGGSSDGGGTVATTATSSTTSASTVGTTLGDPTSDPTTPPSSDGNDELDDGVIDGDWGGGFGDLGLGCNERNVLGSRDAGNVWVVNSNQSTLSKIDHSTLVETARYLTHPDGTGAPGNVSVSRNGDVVVSNHVGGITMVHAMSEYCDAPDASSTGPDDVRPWPDGCVAWFTPVTYLEERVVAWTGGELDEFSCRYEDAKVWSTAVGDDGVDVLMLDGETGVIEEIVATPLASAIPGPINGAVDSQGNFWTARHTGGELVRVDRVTFDVETWPMPTEAYGLAVDAEDRVWACFDGVARFDPGAAQWAIGMISGGGGGCTAGADGSLWLSGDPVVAIDRELLTVVASYDLPDNTSAIAIDFDGFVWNAHLFDQEIYRLDPSSGAVDVVGGIDFPDVQGDMTGTALALVSGQI
jgi:streptogramin lyase